MGKLAGLMKETFPTKLNNEERIDTEWLANQLGVSQTSVYNWFQKERLTGARVNDIIALAQEEPEAKELTKMDFIDFLA